MDGQTARVLVQSLLERLEADARRGDPQMLATVSHQERAAISYLLGSLSQIEPVGAASSEPQRDASQVQDVGTEVTDESLELELGGVQIEVQTNTGAHDEGPAQQVDLKLDVAPSTKDRLTVGPRREAPQLDETAVSHLSPQDAECVLCLDFGTAKSKAFAAVASDHDDPDPQLIELGLGRRDGDMDAIYTVASSIWVSEDGLLFVGSEAMRQSREAVAHGSQRRRLDSIKQQLTLASHEQRLAARRLEPELNPTAVPLSYEDAICLFLAYFTDLAVSELGDRGRSRYVRRRFTIPSWQPEQRSWAASALATYVARAQVLADTFHGQWHSGIPVEHWRSAVAAASAYDTQLAYLLDNGGGAQGILEPLAAGSGRVWADSAAKNLVFVLDVGAGTTDFSLFWVVQNIGGAPPRRAYQVAPFSDAIGMAGDFIDERLLLQLLERAHGSSDEIVRKKFETDLRLRGLRTFKERLFTTNEIQVTLSSGQTVSLTLDEFLENKQVKAVGHEIENAVQRFLSSVRPSWSEVTSNAQIVLTGGGANMPNIKALADRDWAFGGKALRFHKADSVPKFIAENFDMNFQREYPQLAVAIGGALPILGEKSRMEEYMGSAKSPGPLPRYQVTGL